MFGIRVKAEQVSRTYRNIVLAVNDDERQNDLQLDSLQTGSLVFQLNGS